MDPTNIRVTGQGDFVPSERSHVQGQWIGRSLTVVHSIGNELQKGHRCYVEVINKSAKIVTPNPGDELIDEHVAHNQDTAAYLTTTLKAFLNPEAHVTKEAIDKVFQVAIAFDKQVFEKQSIATTSIFAGPMDELHKLVRTHKIAQALNIDDAALLANPKAVKFIESNALHYRIDKTYVERGYGPKINDEGELCFPLNSGTYLEPNVVWTPWDKIPVDKRHKVSCGYGPFGFETGVHPSTPDKIRPIKLVDMPKDIFIEKGQVLVEIVTSKGEKNLLGFVQKLMKGGPGHSWIRTYEPEIDSSGQPTGKCFQYSFGVATPRHRVVSPDIREFKGDKSFTARIIVDSAQWNKIRDDVEKLQKGFLHEEVADDIRQVHDSLLGGTCVNFALYTFGSAYKQVTGKHLHVEGNTVWQTRFLRPIKNLSEASGLTSILSKVTPLALQNLTTTLTEGYMPWVLIDELTKRVDSTGIINQKDQ